MVTLIEPKTTHVTCPGSNWHLAGLVSMEQLTFNYDGLKSAVFRLFTIASRVLMSKRMK